MLLHRIHTVQCFVVPPGSWRGHDKPASEQSSPTHLLFCTRSLSGMDSPGALLRLWLRRSQPRESCLHRERSPLAAANERMCTAVHDSRLAQETLITLITLNPPYRATLDLCFAEGSPSSAATRLRGRHPQVLAPECGVGEGLRNFGVLGFMGFRVPHFGIPARRILPCRICNRK